MIPIPSHTQYSDRIKQCIWSNRYELQEMAQRNLMEFEMEGYDWRNVILEDQMNTIDPITGQRIHPCHLTVQQQQQQQQQSTNHECLDSSSSHVTTTNDGEEKTLVMEENDDDEEEDCCRVFIPLQRTNND